MSVLSFGWASWMARKAALALLLAAAPLTQAKSETFELLGRYELPAGVKILGVAFGGISAIDFDPESGDFLALSDDRGQNGPPRFYEIGLELGPKGISGLDMKAQRPILNGSDAPYKAGEIDPEALRIGPGGAIFWAQEGGASGAPSVGVMGRDGRQIAQFSLPPYYARKGEPGAETSGVRDNYGFEAVALDPKGNVIVGVEQALAQDGPATDFGQASMARVLVLSAEEGRAVAEHVYPIEPVPIEPDAKTDFRTNGLVELLARPEGGFYALERAYIRGKGNFASIFKTSFAGASNVLGAASLKGLSPQPMRKELLLKLPGEIEGLKIDNLEGMSFGPKIGDRRSLVLISDDNFSKSGQVTQILVFTIKE